MLAKFVSLDFPESNFYSIWMSLSRYLVTGFDESGCEQMVGKKAPTLQETRPKLYHRLSLPEIF